MNAKIPQENPYAKPAQTMRRFTRYRCPHCGGEFVGMAEVPIENRRLTKLLGQLGSAVAKAFKR